MTIELNHTIVAAHDQEVAASFVTEILGLPAPSSFGPFTTVQTENGVTLDFLSTRDEIKPQHYAFLVDETQFDEIFGRIQQRELSYWADPGHQTPGEVNTRDGGRGVYFDDPNGHNLEILTRPYGSGE